MSGQILGLISSFLNNRRLQVVLDSKCSQEYPVNAGLPQGSILDPKLFLLYINGLPDDVVCDIVISVTSMLMTLLSILSVIMQLICGNNLKWPPNLNLIYETLISVLGKLSWFHLTVLITMILLMWKRMGLFLRKNHLLRCRGWPSLLNWIGSLTLSILLKPPPIKLEP